MLSGVPQSFSADTASLYPNKPIRMIVPYPPGGGADFIGRAVARKLGETLKQSVVVDNRGGAATAIGAELAARSPADGYTILVATVTTLAVNPNLNPKLAYDVERDFEPISLLASQPQVLVAHPALHVKTLKELIALAKAQPGTLNFASPGIGSGGHLAGELLKSMANIDIVHVGYRGAGPALSDLLGGQVSIMFVTMSTAQPQVNAGKLVALAVSTMKRSSAMPTIPTVAEAGIAGYAMRSWNGLMAPRGTPKAIVQTLNTAIVAALTDAKFAGELIHVGFDPEPSSPADFATFIRQELALHAKVIKAAGLKTH